MLVLHVISCLLFAVHYSQTQTLDTSTHKISLTSGNSAVLTCQVRNLGDSAKVIWLYKSSGDTTVTLTYGRERITSDERFSVDRPYRTDWNLFIRHAKPRDAGTYICKVTTNPPQTKIVNLFIRVAPTINHDLTTKSPLTVKEGQNVNLTCIASAEPAASIMWHFFPFNENVEDRKFPKSVTGETIHIDNISRHQAGIYMCQAFNGIPPVSTKNITINVEFPPIVSTSVPKISQYRGRDTSIDCIIKAYPQEDAVWRKGSVEIGENVWKFVPTVYKQSDTEIILNLQIYTLEQSDFGLYTCEAKNQHGISSATVLIEEIVVTKAPTTTTTVTTTPTTSTTTVTTTTSSISTTMAKNTTTSSILTTTTQKGVIIEENNSSNNNGGGEPPYSVITTPVVKPPDGQGPNGAATSIGIKWTSVAFIIVSVIVMI